MNFIFKWQEQYLTSRPRDRDRVRGSIGLQIGIKGSVR